MKFKLLLDKLLLLLHFYLCLMNHVFYFSIFNDLGTFEILAYTKRNAQVPLKWEDSDPHLIPNAETVKLRSFSTGVFFRLYYSYARFIMLIQQLLIIISYSSCYFNYYIMFLFVHSNYGISLLFCFSVL